MKTSQNSASKKQLKPLTTENVPPFEKDQNKLQLLECKCASTTLLTANLNRVCLQQDALMPLLQMIEYIPSIQRTDSIVKGLMRKIEESEARLAKHVRFQSLIVAIRTSCWRRSSARTRRPASSPRRPRSRRRTWR